jgi:hypothetical protein
MLELIRHASDLRIGGVASVILLRGVGSVTRLDHLRIVEQETPPA